MAKWTFSAFAASQWATTPPVASADLAGKTVVVVGANAGLGFEAAKHFARMGPGKLVLACRSRERGEDALEKLKDETGFDDAEVWIVDLANFASVKSFADKFENEEERLDILVANAGILPPHEYAPTEDGWEPALQVNHLSTSLLGLLLLPKLVRTAEDFAGARPRLVVVASEMHHFGGPFGEDVLGAADPLRTFSSSEAYCTPKILERRYNDTKLLNVLFVRALNDRLQNVPVVVDCVNPGYCHSELRRGLKGPAGWVDRVAERMFARTAEVGSRQIVFAAVSDSAGAGAGASAGGGRGAGGEGGGEGGLGHGHEAGDEDADKDKDGNADALRGAYISDTKVVEPSDYVLSAEGRRAQEVLWADLVKELTAVDGRVQEIVGRYLTEPVSIE